MFCINKKVDANMTETKQSEYIKANIPDNFDDYLIGSGEGCFFLITDENAKHDYNCNKHGVVHWCTLANYSIYWPVLKPGDICPVELRGDKRPVVPFWYLEQWAQGNK